MDTNTAIDSNNKHLVLLTKVRLEDEDEVIIKLSKEHLKIFDEKSKALRAKVSVFNQLATACNELRSYLDKLSDEIGKEGVQMWDAIAETSIGEPYKELGKLPDVGLQYNFEEGTVGAHKKKANAEYKLSSVEKSLLKFLLKSEKDVEDETN